VRTGAVKPKCFQRSAINKVKQKTGKRKEYGHKPNSFVMTTKIFKAYVSKVDIHDDIA
jgi:hypothetical protein